MTYNTITETSLAGFLSALFEGEDSSLVELRWPLGEEMARSFHHPDRAGELQQRISELADRTDVYFGVLPRRRRGGRRCDLAQSARVVWADCDNPEAVRAALGFTLPASLVLRSGSGENRHVYWLLCECATLEEIEQANRRLAAALGSDSGAVTSPTAILRPPSTLNHKHVPPAPVVLEVCEPTWRHPLARLLRRLPALPAPPAPVPAPNAPLSRRAASDDPLRAVAPDVYVERLLHQRVGRSRKVHCPFHDDPRPSLHVYPTAEQGWTCFACRTPSGKLLGGDVYSLASLLWGIPTTGASFIDLRERLEELLL